jgi:hypothetical protein
MGAKLEVMGKVIQRWLDALVVPYELEMDHRAQAWLNKAMRGWSDGEIYRLSLFREGRFSQPTASHTSPQERTPRPQTSAPSWLSSADLTLMKMHTTEQTFFPADFIANVCSFLGCVCVCVCVCMRVRLHVCMCPRTCGCGCSCHSVPSIVFPLSFDVLGCSTLYCSSSSPPI